MTVISVYFFTPVSAANCVISRPRSTCVSLHSAVPFGVSPPAGWEHFRRSDRYAQCRFASHVFSRFASVVFCIASLSAAHLMVKCTILCLVLSCFCCRLHHNPLFCLETFANLHPFHTCCRFRRLWRVEAVASCSGLICHRKHGSLKWHQ